MKEVIISATKTSKTINELPIPATIITEKEITEYNANKLYDIITNQTGIISVPTRSGSQGNQIQGLDAAYTTILIDGFQIIGRAFGALDLNRIFQALEFDLPKHNLKNFLHLALETHVQKNLQFR